MQRAVEREPSLRLGAGLLSGERPQLVVPAGRWQSAVTLGAWTLAGCSVAPGFEFSAFELAPHDFAPGEDGKVPARG